MKIYNTLSKKVGPFEPIDQELVKIYTCGPTVYNNAHIGNLSSYIYADTLRRTLQFAGYKTQHVMNITDVDDKTINRSQEQYPDLDPNEALKQLTEENCAQFFNDMAKIGNNIEEVTFVKATDSIESIQNLIKLLLEKNIAYKASDGIYFNIKEYSKNRKYGQLSKIDLPSEMKSRINNDEYDKDSAQDFALWKATKPHEPSWKFVIASEAMQSNQSHRLPQQTSLPRNDGVNMPGRPGWHIECSAMSVENLGQPFDIHTGGIDLVFPHHENEIAQSTADGQPEKLANYFVHNGHLLVDGEKMSKSKNNFFILNDIEKKGFSPLDFRMLILQSNYQSANNFSWENLRSAHNRLARWRNIAELRHQLPESADNDPQETIINNLLEQAGEALLNNLNTPEALKLLDKVVDKASSSYSLDTVANFIKFVDQNLGLQLEETTPDISDNIKEMIQLRATVRANGNFEKSDEIRDTLLAQNIKLNDIPDGVIWSRI